MYNLHSRPTVTHPINEALEYATLNAANVLFLLVTFRWHELIPPPDRLLEWGLGMAVGVSLLAVNALKVYRLWQNKHRKHYEE